MKKIKHFIAILTAASIFTMSSEGLDAQEYYVDDCGGIGYQESWMAPSLTPYIALTTVIIAAIVVIAVRHSGHGHGHSH